LLFCQRYIELNPVRASMVTDPSDYRWSSYRANGLGQHDPLLTPHPCYLALGADDAKRRAAYRDLFGSALEEVPLSELRMALNQDQPIGNDRFYREIESMTNQRRELRKRGRRLRKPEDDRFRRSSDEGELPLN
jgi:putative transposase